jgi:2',3'-cyclic-nucleotide 2'-phosphodiesterase/3'-nucleotidase/5'-nucleotidase
MTTSNIVRALAVLCLAGAPAAAQDTAHVVVVSTTDIHGHATGWDFIEGRAFPGGLTRAATVVDSLRARYPGEVVLVDAGDLISGDPFAAYFASHPRSPHPMLEAMDALEYDAITPGNHEFNYGFEFFRDAYHGRNFRAVCGNCVFPGRGVDGRDSLMFPPYAVVSRGRVRVAVAGFTTPGAMVWDGDKLRGKLTIRPVGDQSRLFAEMRRQADLVVTVIHSGMDGAASYDTAGIGDENVAATLARGSTRPDLVVVGHSHREMRDSVLNGVHFVQPKNWAQSLSVVHLTLRRRGAAWAVDKVDAQLVPLANVPESPRLARRLEQSRAFVGTWAEEQVAFSTGAFDAQAGRTGATPLINWIGEVQRRAAGADLAATAAFSTRRGLPAGDIRRADIFAVYPYENTLRAVRISGADLRAYLEQSAQYYAIGADGKLGFNAAIPGYNFDIVTGADYDLDLSRPVGQRITRLEVRGRAVAPTDSFNLAVNNYRQVGGGGFQMLSRARVVYDKGEGIRELLEKAAATDTLRPERYARASWRIVPREREDQARILAGLAPRAVAATPRDTIILRILATNDLHGQTDPRVWSWSNERPLGGLATLKTLMDSLAADCGGCPVLRLDGGDEFQGTLSSNITYGRPVVEAFNRIGLNAAVVGNHDLDWGVDSLQKRIAESRYPWLAANILDSATGRRPDWIKGWTMLQAGPRKVAVIGYAHPATPRMTFRAAVAGLKFVDGPEPVRAAIREAREQKADLIVLLAHYGGDCRESCSGELFRLVDSLGPGQLDAVIGGHSHQTVYGVSSTGVPVLQGGSSGRAVARIDLVRTVVGAREARTAIDTAWADRIRPDKGVDSLLARYRPAVDSLARRRIANLALPMNRSGTEFPLGRLIADANRNALRTDIAIVNNGGIRRDLPAGQLEFGVAYELLPFGNRLVKVTLPGSAVKQLLENLVAAGSPRAHISGITVRYDSTARRGDRIRDVRFADGSKLADRKEYTLSVPDFLAQGAEEFAVLTRYPQDPVGLLDLDAFTGYLRRMPQPVQPPVDARWVARR